MTPETSSNIDLRTVEGFGEEWAAFDQVALDRDEHGRSFDLYFGLFPFDELMQAEGFDLGCGSGRWAALVAPRVGKLHCIDPSDKALGVARRRLASEVNVEFHRAGAHEIPLRDGSQDFAYSLGVLHHIPDTEAAMAQCVGKLKPGAPLLVYLYYRFDHRPTWYRATWRLTDWARRGISRLPFGLRRALSEGIAATVYYPLARASKLGARAGLDVSHWPLSNYRDCGLYTMRTDALDRFGTRLEHRFTRAEIDAMMRRCGLTDVRFSDRPPYWIAIGRKARVACAE